MVLAAQPPAQAEGVAAPDVPCDRPNPSVVCVCDADLDVEPTCARLFVRSGSSVAPISQRLRSFGLSLGVRVRILRKRVLPVFHKTAKLCVSFNVCAMAPSAFTNSIRRIACWIETHKDFNALWALVCVSVDRIKRHHLTSGGRGRKCVTLHDTPLESIQRAS